MRISVQVQIHQGLLVFMSIKLDHIHYKITHYRFYKHSTNDLQQNTRPFAYHNLCLKHRAYPDSNGAPQLLMLQLKKSFCITTLQVTIEKMMETSKEFIFIAAIPCTWQPTPQKRRRLTPAACQRMKIHMNM